MMMQEHPALKQAKYIALKPQDREIYLNHKLRQWFDANNRYYNTARNGESVGKLIDLNIRYEDLCNDIHAKYPVVPVFAGQKYRTSIKLTEPVKILLKNRDVAKQFDKCIAQFVGPIFNELVLQRKTKKIEEELPTLIEPIHEPIHEPIQLQKTKIIDFQSILAEFADEDWE